MHLQCVYYSGTADSPMCQSFPSWRTGVQLDGRACYQMMWSGKEVFITVLGLRILLRRRPWLVGSPLKIIFLEGGSQAAEW